MALIEIDGLPGFTYENSMVIFQPDDSVKFSGSSPHGAVIAVASRRLLRWLEGCPSQGAHVFRYAMAAMAAMAAIAAMAIG